MGHSDVFARRVSYGLDGIFDDNIYMTTQRRTLFLSSRHSRMKAKVPCSRGKLSRVDAAATPDDYSIKLPVTEAENWSALAPSAVATKKFRWLSRSRPSSLATPGSRSFRARQWGLLQRTPTSRQCRASRKGVLKADYTAVLEVLDVDATEGDADARSTCRVFRSCR